MEEEAMGEATAGGPPVLTGTLREGGGTVMGCTASMETSTTTTDRTAETTNMAEQRTSGTPTGTGKN